MRLDPDPGLLELGGGVAPLHRAVQTRSLPAVPKNWTRDYFFLANGYEKDMDFYAAEGATVEPLPFRSMGTYPYPGKSFPLDEKHLDYLLNFNTRQMSGNEPQGYWYDYSHPK